MPPTRLALRRAAAVCVVVLIVNLLGFSTAKAHIPPAARGRLGRLLEGSGVEDLVTSGLGSPRGIALDLAGGKMYWTDIRKIQRANLDGSGVEDLVTGWQNFKGIALDLAGG